MGGTAPSLLVFFSSTNPHYLLAKPDSKGLSTANLPPSCSSGNVRPNLAVPIPYTGIPPKQTLKLRWFDPPYWIFHAWIKFRMAYQHCLNQFCAFSVYHLPKQVPPNSNSQLFCMQKTAGRKCIISAFSPDPSSIIIYPCQLLTNLSNKTYQAKFMKPNLPNQIYPKNLTFEFIKPNLWNHT